MVSANPAGNSDFLEGYITAPRGVDPATAMRPTMPAMPGMPATPAAAPLPPPRVDPRTAEPIEEYQSSEFERLHGRLPTYQERVLIRALPGITQQLGRPPSRIELLQFVSQRDVTVRETQQFEVTRDDAALSGQPGQPVVDPGAGAV